MTRFLALAAFCLLLSAFYFLPHALSAQNTKPSPSPTPQSSPTPAPSPSPTPTPTPPPTLHQWGAVTLFHGLPSDRVRAIAQGADGTMWFGTDGGLAKYDGRRTQAVLAEGLPTGRVLALKFDEDGVLWIGTEAGAARLVNEEFRAIEETKGKAITAIITPERGRAVLASDAGLIFDCGVKTDGTLAVVSIPDAPLQSADTDHPGALPITSLAFMNGTLYASTLSRGLLAIEHGAVREVQSRPRPFFVTALETDKGGKLWLGERKKKKDEDSGFYDESDLSKPSKINANTGTILSLRAGARDDLWAGTDGRGVFHFKGLKQIERFTFEGTAGGLRSDYIFSIFVDREEVVWFGTDKGVCRYDPHAPRIENLGDNPESNFVRTLFQTSDGRILSGTNRGLFIYDRARAVWYPVAELSRNIIYALAEDKAGRLLVGSASGLYASQRQARGIESNAAFSRLEAGSGEVDAVGSVRSIVQFQGATFFVSYGRGLERVDGSSVNLIWPVDETDAHLREVVGLYASRDGRLLIGTASAGLFSYDGKRVTPVPSFEKLAGSPVRSIVEAGDGVMWIGTGRGLYSFKNNDLTMVAAGYDVRSLLVIGDNASSQQLWVATAGGGALLVSMDRQFGPLIASLDAEQGLPTQFAFAVLPSRTEDGDESYFIGTSRGVARYEPGHMPPALSPTRLISQRIHSLDELRAGVALEYPQNSLVLDVNATSSRTFPEQFQYAFLLFDNAGHIIKRKLAHDAQFTMENLRPGKYHVEARAFTKDLIASEPLSFEFTVAGAPFPRTTVALSVLLALALVALLWGYLQNRRIHRTSAALVAANRQLADARLQLANEAETERRRIARDLHDQTLADLRQLLLLTDQLPANGDGAKEKRPSTTVFRAEIEAISHEIRRICEDLSPSVLENVGFAAALEFALSNAVAHAPPDRQFEYQFECDENFEDHMQLAPSVQMQIYRIAQEVVSNICRHASATSVRLHVSLTDAGELLLQIEDDGRGFDPNERKHRTGRGLANIRARASLIEAEVKWNKRAEGGNVFTLRKAAAAEVKS